jgi:hypothetical protein
LTRARTLDQSAAMNVRTFCYALAILFATAAISADREQSKDEKPPLQSSCVSQCASNEQRCSREVRRARTECQRVAANGGRDPYTGRPSTYNNNGGRRETDNGVDYGAFCNYFAHPDLSCGSGYYSGDCQRRLSHRHGICLNAMNNIASLRYDCYRTERDATHQCREDLRDCQATCQ